MKKSMGMHTKRWLSGFLAAVLALSPLAIDPAFAATLGELLQTKSLNIASETVLANGVYWNSSLSDKLTENYIIYEPSEEVRPIIAYGRDVYGAASFATAAEVATSEFGGGSVLAGINGDYFTVSNGVPQGLTIKDGIIYTSETTGYPSVGFYENGEAIIGRANLKIKLSSSALASAIPSLHMNKVMTPACGVVLYTDEFTDDDTNKASIATYNVLVQVTDGEARINGVLNGTVYSVAPGIASTAIPPGMVLLSMASGTTYTSTLNQLKTLKEGDPVSIEFTADQTWEGVTYGIGAGEKIVTAGANVAPMTMSIQTALNPRTAIGIKQDGTLVFYTIDGRKAGHSKGVTLAELAKRMIELGCVEAVNMDGGGSTAVHSIYPGNSVLSTVNTPSEGSLRNCANYIMLLNTASADGRTKHLHPYPYNVQILSGARQSFTLKATDENYYASSAPAQSELSYSAENNLGTFDSAGIFTAGTQAGSGTLTFKDDEALGTATVTVVSKPDSISLASQGSGTAVTTVSVSGGNTFDLAVSALYKKMPLTVMDSCFTWSVSGNIGTIDQNGLFTAAKLTSGSGTITASIAGLSASVPVTITSSGQLIESFEGTTSVIPAIESSAITVKSNNDLTKVRYGYKSAEVQYDFSKTEEEIISIPTTISFTTNPDTLSFWVYGDGSGNTINAYVTNSSGASEILVDTLSFTGWKLVSVELPNGSTAIQALYLKKAGSDAGTIYIDQIMRAIGYYIDVTSPTIQLTVTGQSVTAVVNDLMDTALSPANMKLTYDGEALTFTYDATTKKMAASLPATDGNAHKLTLTAADRSGNLKRESIVVPATQGATVPFADMGSHWAKDSTAYLYNQNIVKGVSTSQGLLYKPDTGITRAEFTVMMSRWLGIDETKYQTTVLPFADAAAIPSWALGSVKAMYEKGIVQGSASGTKLNFKPNGTISREEVMTIIGRTQQRGFAEADLSTYSDGASVSSWSLPYVKSLVEQEVVTGYNGGLWPKNAVTRAQIATIIYKLD
ncbi:MAG: phosphodiester glycosidase family protein [Eubacteriales bacterium]|nr:phosphodiester glycosidase family protein [Eubacteriales bacterium]MDD3349589.1 phosphodiester glycosidase family protein [Eubacteriales bacterium]